MPSDMVEKRDSNSQSTRLDGRGLWGDMDTRFVEVHYKTYHWMEHKDGDREYAGFEHYIQYNWKV